MLILEICFISNLEYQTQKLMGHIEGILHSRGTEEFQGWEFCQVQPPLFPVLKSLPQYPHQVFTQLGKNTSSDRELAVSPCTPFIFGIFWIIETCLLMTLPFFCIKVLHMFENIIKTSRSCLGFRSNCVLPPTVSQIDFFNKNLYTIAFAFLWMGSNYHPWAMEPSASVWLELAIAPLVLDGTYLPMQPKIALAFLGSTSELMNA